MRLSIRSGSLMRDEKPAIDRCLLATSRCIEAASSAI